MTCDLHAHSTASDGLTPPSDLAHRAAEAGLEAFALTDHDTTAGVAEAAQAAEKAGLAFLPGIELSSDPFSILDTPPTVRFGTLHILGYGIDPDHPGLNAVCDELKQARDERNPEIVDKLNTLGVRIDYQQVIDHATETGSGVVGRPHIAAVLEKHGYVRSHHEAFKRYIGEGAPAYVRKDALSAERAIATLHEAGGLAVLAHPIQLTRDRDLLGRAVLRLRELGIDGIEVIHPDQKSGTRQGLAHLARKLGLFMTGGSDYHGKEHGAKLGAMRVPLTYYQTVAERLTRAAG
ncbi:PHP domain-containing protein [Mucisphaera sp.]|uniref:PHP domain-containing protein n=1 Tax=Mucisphaera sp. TaxID=2913024 RepID=UPI003D0C390C